MSAVVRAPTIVPHATAKVDTLLVSSGVCLMAIAAQISVPLPFTPVPLTGQTLAVLLVAASLGPMRGVVSVVAYLMVGCLGAPVFAGGSAGVAVVFSATGGYLPGMVLAAVAVGIAANRGWGRRLAFCVFGMAIGSALIYLVGAIWLAGSMDLNLQQAWRLGVQPFLLGDAVKAAIAGTALPTVWRWVARADETSGRATR